jgi:hypothetical protein
VLISGSLLLPMSSRALGQDFVFHKTSMTYSVQGPQAQLHLLPLSATAFGETGSPAQSGLPRGQQPQPEVMSYHRYCNRTPGLSAQRVA